MSRYKVAPAEVGLLSHATTVVTNAILEESGARAALITTRGFRDVLELRRSARADLYDLFQDAPATLIPRRRRFEITERIGADGAVVTPLAESEIEGLIAALEGGAGRCDCGLARVQLPQPGARAAARRAAAGGAAGRASLSVVGRVARDQGVRAHQHDRGLCLCRANSRLLSRAARRRSRASRALPPLYLMGSNGGILEAAEAIAMPAMAVESGPAAGVVAAALVARQTGRLDLLSFDMGGTTAKASLIRGGQYETTPEYEVGGGSSMSRWMNGTGHPIRVPVIDLAEVSAGGGSIAWVDRAGALRVGPKSAGADPGPVCYGRGGSEPTVTDCDLLLGYLDKASLLGGRAADRSCGGAKRPFAQRLAEPLGVDVRTAAAAVIDVVNHAMAEALKIVSVQRGHDPRDFVLAAFGGAGPLHAAALASELGIAEVICPPIPGAFSALGLIGTDLKRDYVRRSSRPPSRRSGGAGGRLRRARAQGSGHARPSRRRARAAAVRALRRCALSRANPMSCRCRFRPRPVDQATLDEIAEAFTIVTCRPMATTIAASRCRSSAFASPRSARSRRSRSATRRRLPGRTRSRRKRRALVPRHRRGRRPRSMIAARMPAGLAVAGPAVIEIARVHHPCPAGMAG